MVAMMTSTVTAFAGSNEMVVGTTSEKAVTMAIDDLLSSAPLELHSEMPVLWLLFFVEIEDIGVNIIICHVKPHYDPQ